MKHLVAFEKMFEKDEDNNTPMTELDDLEKIATEEQSTRLDAYTKNYGFILGKMLYMTGNSISLSRWLSPQNMNKVLTGNSSKSMFEINGEYKIIYDGDAKYKDILYDEGNIQVIDFNRKVNNGDVYECVLPLTMRVSLESYFNALIPDVSSERGFSFEGTMCGLFNGELSDTYRKNAEMTPDDKAKEDVYLKYDNTAVGYSLKFYKEIKNEIHSASYKQRIMKFMGVNKTNVKYNEIDDKKTVETKGGIENVINYYIAYRLLFDKNYGLGKMYNIQINDVENIYKNIVTIDNNGNVMYNKEIMLNLKNNENYNPNEKCYYYHGTLYKELKDVQSRMITDISDIINGLADDGIFSIIIGTSGEKSDEIIRTDKAKDATVINGTNTTIKKNANVSSTIDLYLIKKETIISALNREDSGINLKIDNDNGISFNIKTPNNFKFAKIIPPIVNTDDIEKSYNEENIKVLKAAKEKFNGNGDATINKELEETNIFFLKVMLDYANKKQQGNQ